MLKKSISIIIGILLVACSSESIQSPTVSPQQATLIKVLPTSIPSTATPTSGPPINATSSGIITRDEIWRDEIHLTGDITMANGVMLTIEPGTTVYIASNSDDQRRGVGYHDDYVDSHNDPVRMEIWDQNAVTIDGRNGIINAIGTPDEPITFRPEGDSTSPAQWDAIYIERGTLQHAIVLYGGRTAVQILGNYGDVEIAYNEVRYFLWAGISAQINNVWIHHNIVEGGGHQAIGVRGNTLAEHNIVIGAQTGIGIEHGNGAIIRNNIVIDCVHGIELRSGGDIEVVNNTIAWVNGPPDGWYYQGKIVYPAFRNGGGIENYLDSPQVIVLNNIIYGPFDWGIGLHQQLGEGSFVDYNLMWGQPSQYAGGGQSAAGMHNFSQDPLFSDPTNGDFSVLDGSPAIDAGAPTILDADGSISDLGAYGGPEGEGW